MKITIFHSGGDLSYLYGFINGIVSDKDIKIDVIDTEQSKNIFSNYKNIKLFVFLKNLNRDASFLSRLYRVIRPYLKIFVYTISTDSKIFHVQWFNRFHFVDKTFLLLYYKMFSKKVIYTAHNVNTRERNNNENIINNLSLKFFYKKVDHIIVHNNKSKRELVSKFNVNPEKISVFKIGLNIFTHQNNVSKQDALYKLKLPINKKIILFFGAINVYKGLEDLVNAFRMLNSSNPGYHLVIAGESRNNNYFNNIKLLIKEKLDKKNFSTFFKYIPNEEVEYFFAAADCLVLPYKAISQSGLHVLSYSYGLPVIATDVGSFREEDIIENNTGLICNPNNVEDLYKTIEKYFNSSMYNDLSSTRQKIRRWAKETYSWEVIGSQTIDCYRKLLQY